MEEKRGVTAERIVSLLSARKMSQSDLARATNLTSAAICRYSNGERVPKGAILLSLANALGTSVKYLLGDEDEPFAASKETDINEAIKLIARNARTMTAEEKLKIAEILFEREAGGNSDDRSC